MKSLLYIFGALIFINYFTLKSAFSVDVYDGDKKIYHNDSVISVRWAGQKVLVLNIFPGKDKSFAGRDISYRQKKSSFKYDEASLIDDGQ